MLEHALRCSVRSCLARVWFGTRLLLGPTCSTTLVFGTRPHSRPFAPTYTLSQSHGLPPRLSDALSSSSSKRPLSVLAMDRNVDVITSSRFSLSRAAPS
ncbi:hypothetical protein C8Q70DRAFT_1033955 [Cubamyces menziesii]|nr:hypothetical protein C8Q70DRAFT_1033955 [Cubamyces menziesii]